MAGLDSGAGAGDDSPPAGNLMGVSCSLEDHQDQKPGAAYESIREFMPTAQSNVAAHG